MSNRTSGRLSDRTSSRVPSSRASRHLRAGLLPLAIVLLLAACRPASPEPAVTLPSAPVVVVADTVPIPFQAGSLAQVRAHLPYAILLPAWVPEGYRLADQISVAADSAWVLLEWQHKSGALLDLIISPYAPATPDAPPQFIKAVDVSGQPALFIFGLHNSAAGRWDPALQTLLTWQAGDLHYSLATAGMAASTQDLQHMAASLS
jgi:hypothetical protein